MTLTLLLAALTAQAPAAAPPVPASMARPIASELLARAPPADWRAIPSDDLLVMELADRSRVVIELAPRFAPRHVANIRTLARAHWWDGTSINRVQDDYVVQWGDPSGHKPLPAGIVAQPPAEYERPLAGLGVRPLGYRDSYATQTGHDADGWPVASEAGRAWLTHCYAMIGVGRDLPPDSGSGAELYAVIGHAPRQLDRNIALVGRVVAGMEALAARPRGGAALGFYDDAALRIPIVRVRLASDLPPAERPAFEVLRPASASFAAWVDARANRRDPFFVRPAGAVDICNAQAPVRAVTR